MVLEAGKSRSMLLEYGDRFCAIPWHGGRPGEEACDRYN